MLAESYDPVTELSIIDMLHYCLEHSDKYLPLKGWRVLKVSFFTRFTYVLLLFFFFLFKFYQIGFIENGKY